MGAINEGGSAGGKWGACCASRIGARRTEASTGGFQMMKCRYKKVF